MAKKYLRDCFGFRGLDTEVEEGERQRRRCTGSRGSETGWEQHLRRRSLGADKVPERELEGQSSAMAKGKARIERRIRELGMLTEGSSSVEGDRCP